jgi:hypothetical protein
MQFYVEVNHNAETKRIYKQSVFICNAGQSFYKIDFFLVDIWDDNSPM